MIKKLLGLLVASMISLAAFAQKDYSFIKDVEPYSVKMIMSEMARNQDGTYLDGRKLRDLALLDCIVTLEYDRGVPEGAQDAIRELFSRESVIVTKKSKNGIVDQDIIPMIRKLDVVCEDTHTMLLKARICCQNPTLNPAQLTAAISAYLQEYTPDFTKCSRLEIYDAQEEIFR